MSITEADLIDEEFHEPRQKLKAVIAQLTAENQRLRERADELDSLAAEIAAELTENSELQERAEIAAELTENSELQERVEALLATEIDLRDDIQRANYETRRAVEDNKRLRTEFDAAIAQCERVTAENQRLRERVAELDRSHTALEQIASGTHPQPKKFAQYVLEGGDPEPWS